jgi:putative SOS response-associated peptidase YedK
MCYDIQAKLDAQLNHLRFKGDQKEIDRIIEKIERFNKYPVYHVSGFQHPTLFIFTGEDPNVPTASTWGLVPHWVKDKDQLKKFWNNTLNARGETIFEKPSFRDSARRKRCLIYVNGFYEHHYFNGKTYPYFIYHREKEPLALAGLWSEWVDKETGEILNTFSIVTTEGNSLLEKIHNNPKLKGPRMPLILVPKMEDRWIDPENNDPDMISDIIKPCPSELLLSHTVHRLRGKDYMGNVEEISDPVSYQELPQL